jgi:hypothetical protein
MAHRSARSGVWDRVRAEPVQAPIFNWSADGKWLYVACSTSVCVRPAPSSFPVSGVPLAILFPKGMRSEQEVLATLAQRC